MFLLFESLTVTLEPEDVSKNELITLKASGVLVKPTTKGTYTLDVKYAGTTLYSHTGNVCGNEKVAVVGAVVVTVRIWAIE